MRHEDKIRIPVDGYFQPAQHYRSRRRFIPASLTLVILGAAGLAAQSPVLLVIAVTSAIGVLLLSRLRSEPEFARVNLSASDLTIRGGGYDILLQAPFRFKTGVERKPATARQDETCFVRMVVDVRGKPLVFEEQVLTGNYPPPLDEIVGESSALGMAELTSLTPFPGTLWALIERLDSLAQATVQSERNEQIKSLHRIGREQMTDGRYGKAIGTFSTIILQRPDSALAYYNRGSARYYAREELDKAAADLTTALRLDPNQHRVYRMRGLVHAQQGNWARMRDDCSSALQFQPTSAELFNLRGTACYRLHDYDAALTNFERAVDLDAGRHESFYNRGLTRRQQGKLVEALEDFQHALKLNPAFVGAQQCSEAVQQQLAQSNANSESQATS